MKLIQRIKEGANRATEKAQHAVEISKINSQITTIQQEMDVHFLRMGQIFTKATEHPTCRWQRPR